MTFIKEVIIFCPIMFFLCICLFYYFFNIVIEQIYLQLSDYSLVCWFNASYSYGTHLSKVQHLSNEISATSVVISTLRQLYLFRQLLSIDGQLFDRQLAISWLFSSRSRTILFREFSVKFRQVYAVCIRQEFLFIYILNRNFICEFDRQRTPCKYNSKEFASQIK